MMIVADSSYLVHGLLKDAALLENDDAIVSPDLALYDVINAIWKHEAVLKDIKGGSRHIAMLSELESSGRLRFVRPDRQVIDRTYQLALRKKCALYDAVFVALASDLGLELKTFDVVQKGLMH
jgi:predicted nucleic acid-binding protein